MTSMSSLDALQRRVQQAMENPGPDSGSSARLAARLKPEIEASFEAARGRNIAILPTLEYEGIWRNGGIGTFYRGLGLQLRGHGWFTVLLNLNCVRAADPCAGLEGLDHILNIGDFDEILQQTGLSESMLSAARENHQGELGTKCLLLIQAMANTFAGQRIYVEFHEMEGMGYESAKAKEAGLLGPEVVIATTMHSGKEWIYETNGGTLGEDNAAYLLTATREEESFRSADAGIFPSDSLHSHVRSYGWRTDHAVKIPNPIPLQETA